MVTTVYCTYTILYIIVFYGIYCNRFNIVDGMKLNTLSFKT